MITIGKTYKFVYPDYGTPDGHPDYTAHSGLPVTVLRQLTNAECDPECQPMFEVKAEDGWKGHVMDDELISKEDMNNDKMPPAVLAAFCHVRQFHPKVRIVVFNSDSRWCYMDEDFGAFVFGPEIDVSILEDAIDVVEILPAVFEYH